LVGVLDHLAHGRLCRTAIFSYPETGCRLADHRLGGRDLCGAVELELELLGRARTAPVLLRRAFLELRNSHPQAAIDATAEVLYGPTPPSANEESFARYLRAEAYTQKGTPELGVFDLSRARLLALDPELRRRLPEPNPVAMGTPDVGQDTAPSAVTILARSAWGAKAADRSNLEPMVRPTRVTIHHSAMYFRDTRPASCKTQLQMIQREHMGNRGYGDIGYHYIIDPSGRIWEGREMRWQGAHASGNNNIANIGVCLLGNFMRGRSGQGPTPAQVTSMRMLVESLMKRYGFGADAIYCHSDFKATECPGPLLESVVTQLARDLRRRGSSPVAGISTPRPAKAAGIAP
jgi:hypothetical protein